MTVFIAKATIEKHPSSENGFIFEWNVFSEDPFVDEPIAFGFEVNLEDAKAAIILNINPLIFP